MILLLHLQAKGQWHIFGSLSMGGTQSLVEMWGHNQHWDWQHTHAVTLSPSVCHIVGYHQFQRILFTSYIHQYESWGNCYSISKQSMVHNVCFVHPNLKACWLDQIKISFGGHIDAFIEYKQKCLRQMVLFHPIIWWFWFVHCSHVDNYIRCCKWMTLLLVNDCNVWIVIAECWSRIQYFLHFHAWFLSLEYGKEVCASKLDGATDQRQLISSSLLSPVVFLQEGHLVLLSSVKKAICSALWETTVWNGVCK